MTTRTKILIVAPRFTDAIHGERRAMKSAVTTAYGLSKHAEIVVVTAGPPPKKERLGEHLKIYRLWDFFLPDPINYGIVPGLFWSLGMILHKERPDAVLINKHMFFTSLVAPLVRLLGYRVIIQTDTFPGIIWFPRNTVVKLVMQLYAYTLGLLVLKSAHEVVLLHEGLIPVARWLRLPYRVIHNGVDLSQFDAATTATDIQKTAGEIAICYVGRLESVKGYDDLLAVAASISKTTPQARFYIVGSTQGRETVVGRYASDRIHFLGHRSDVPSVLKAMDIFVLPSYAEGLPNALMEAMAARCACIGSNVGGIKILLRHNRGLRFPPGDQERLQFQLNQLITNQQLRTTLGTSARKLIELEFDTNKEIQRLCIVCTTHTHKHHG